MSEFPCKAYCWRNGEIAFGEPEEGTMIFATVETQAHRDAIEVCARHSRTSERLFIPGIPEADDDTEAHVALGAFILQLQKRGVPSEPAYCMGEAEDV